MHVVPQVCGGNPGLLLRAATTQDDGDLDAGEQCNISSAVCAALSLVVSAASDGVLHAHAALVDVLTSVRPSMQRALMPGPGAGWTAEQYVVAVRAITAGAPYAVLASELEAQFGGVYAGSQILQAMVHANLVAYRPYSRWARDLPVGVFRASDSLNTKLGVVVTAPTPAHLHCMRELTLPDATLPAESVQPVGH